MSETDLQLLHAPQISPRVPWNVLGDVLGISPTTAARRWARLSADGRASYAALAAAVSEPTLRRLRRLLGTGRVAVRCDVAWEAAG
ncbi:AsnC family protein [Streptomyces sp. NPDC006134]|uniref:AsnC family protein n=1 Tax=Streptomyces sp. NPDC006134 TaxID=3154467 RepID=UPI003408AF39